jgi:predicted aspartyl protease
MKTVSLVSFERTAALIVVPVTIKIGAEIFKYKFAVDTGATISLMDIDLMPNIGYKPENCIRTVHTVTASKTETAYEFEIDNIMAIGLIRRNFNIISRSLPVELGIDGLLGLNFFKNTELTIDFKLSEIRLK